MDSAQKILLTFSMMLLCLRAQSQEKTTSPLSPKFTGTWAGTISQQDTTNTLPKVVSFMWRIHSIDSLKREVQVTEVGRHFSDGSAIENPEKKTYKGTYSDSTLVIEYVNPAKKEKFVFKLKRKITGDMMLMQGSTVVESSGKKLTYDYTIAKFSDDTSIYVKPKEGEIEVAIASPPPVKH